MRGSVNGRVVRADNGEPVEDATVMVLRGAGPAPDIAALTNSAGWFALDELPEGEWLLRAVSTAGETGEARVDVCAGTLASITIEVTRSRSAPK